MHESPVKSQISGKTEATGFIRVRGASQHNLKKVSVDIPHDALTVITGPSGSGKSSLAIETVFAYGQRQFVETLSGWSRKLARQFPRPRVESVEGLLPAVCIDQVPSWSSPRSTVATVTGIHDYLRLLYSRGGTIRCPSCKVAIRQTPVGRIVEFVESLPEGSRVMVLAPMVSQTAGRHESVFEQIRKCGLLRTRVDGMVLEIEPAPELDSASPHTIEAVADRIAVRPGNSSRILESVELAIRLSEGPCTICWQSANGSSEQWEEEAFNTRFACPRCHNPVKAPEPSDFSFNSPAGACPKCNGLGWMEQFDDEAVLDRPDRSLADGAISAWRDLSRTAMEKRISGLAQWLESSGLTVDAPVVMYPRDARHKLLRGDGEFRGVLGGLEHEYATTLDDKRLETLGSLRGSFPCPDCVAGRLGPHIEAVTFYDKNIVELCRMTVDESSAFFEKAKAPSPETPAVERVAGEIGMRLKFLQDTGLGYLTLERPADSLSGGEFQRVRLAAALGSGLANVCYVLDEPTTGLHPVDTARLISVMRQLVEASNTVIVVEHDADVMREADWVIDMGPGAGQRGGEVVFQGTCAELQESANSVTGPWLAGKLQIQRKQPGPNARKSPDKIRLRGACGNNLQHVDLEIPLGCLVAVSGVSGSGKSSLILDTLLPALARHLGRIAPRPLSHEGLDVPDGVKNVVAVNQRWAGRSLRANAATLTGMMPDLRRLFAATAEAKLRGMGAEQFSFNSPAGWCPVCRGLGQVRSTMKWIPNLWSECPECNGQRYSAESQSILYRGRSLSDVLAMSVEAVGEFFVNVPRIHAAASALCRVGLGYLVIGQPSSTFSGGESQRIRLAQGLSRKASAHTVYLLDEPTTGLHFEDVQRLLEVLEELAGQGNTVVMIEHHPELIAAADHEIRLGPGAGKFGGRIVYAGAPAVSS